MRESSIDLRRIFSLINSFFDFFCRIPEKRFCAEALSQEGPKTTAATTAAVEKKLYNFIDN